MSTEARRRRNAEHTILEAWPDDLGQRVLAAISEHDAFGALAWRIEHAYRNGHNPVALLREIDEDTVEWAIEDAANPAAFLASRIPRDDD